MTPWTKLFCGDARAILPTLTTPVDVLITDPVWPNCPEGMLQGHADPEGLLRQTLDLVAPARIVIVMRIDSDPRFLRAVDAKRYPFIRVQVLPYVMPAYIGRVLGGDELAYSFGAAPASEAGRRVLPCYAPKVQPQDRPPIGHPCSRALKHFEWLMRWWTSPGQTVLDPFMGSGTTGVAAVKAGCNFIGVEIELHYFSQAEQRIVAAKRQHDCFAEGAHA